MSTQIVADAITDLKGKILCKASDTENVSIPHENALGTRVCRDQITTNDDVRDNDAFAIDDYRVVSCMGDQIYVFCPAEDVYYPDTVGSVNKDCKFNIDYENDEDECLYILIEVWKFRHLQTSTGSACFNFESIDLDSENIMQDDLSKYAIALGNNAF